MSKTKIVATIGPSSRELKTLRKLIRSGMDVARLNFSHGTHEDHKRTLDLIRRAARLENAPVAVIQDLQGPRIRLGKLEGNLQVKKGQKLVLHPEGQKMKKTNGALPVPITYANMCKDVKKGERLLIEDGTISLSIDGVKDGLILCTALTECTLKSNKGMNLPDSCLSIDPITAKDRADLPWGIANEVDFVALSFPKSAKDVLRLRDLIEKEEAKRLHEDKTMRLSNRHRQHHRTRTKIIVKIERPEAVNNIDEIIEATDAVMVARGDLGIEMPLEKLPLIQKQIIEKCLHAAKPVIVATQMLNSMIESPIPTRAEVSDVANAIIDGADAIMLSGETASGQYPVEAVETMERIAKEAEGREIEEAELFTKHFSVNNVTQSVGTAANILAKQLKVKSIVCTTTSGFTARNISRFKPVNRIIAVTPFPYTQRQLNLSWGVEPILIKELNNFDVVINEAKNTIIKKKMGVKDETIIITAGHPFGYNSGTNLIKVDRL